MYKMTAIGGDNLTKSEVKFQTVSELMAKKRKLYLHKRVKTVDGNSKSNNKNNIDTTYNVTKKLTPGEEEFTLTSQTQQLTSTITTTLIRKSNTNINSKCTFRNNNCFTSFETASSPSSTTRTTTRTSSSVADEPLRKSKEYYYEYNPELRISMERNDTCFNQESNVRRLSADAEKYINNCSCNKKNNNCHCSCRPPQYHHKNVLKYKSAQESSTSHINNSNNNQEIHMQNSYYLLRDPYQHHKHHPQQQQLINPTQMEQNFNKQKSSCATSTMKTITTTTTSIEESRTTLRPPPSPLPSPACSSINCDEKELNAKLQTSIQIPATCLFTTKNNKYNTNVPNNINIKSNRRFFTTTQGFLLQFYNIVMILKTFIVLVTRTLPSLLSLCPPTPLNDNNDDNKTKCHDHVQDQNDHQNNSLQQRLTYFKDQKPQPQIRQRNYYYNKPKSSLHHHTPNVSFTKWILMVLSFLTICLPLTQALTTSDFETTLQSSLAALQRTPRDVGSTNELQNQETSTNKQVRLTRPEHGKLNKIFVFTNFIKL